MDDQTNPLTEKLRPWVKRIEASARRGNGEAKQVIDLYAMHRSCPRDAGAMALCEAAFETWMCSYKPET